MEKFLTLIFTSSLLLFSSSYRAEAVTPLSDIDEVYVRKDAYQSDMRNINNKLDNILVEIKNLHEDVKVQRNDINELKKDVASLSERIDGVNKTLSDKIDGVNKTLSEKIDGVDKRLSEKIDGVNNSLSEKIDGTSTRVDDLRNGLYLAFTLVTVVASLPFLKKWYEEHAQQKLEAMKASFTLEDVKKLIEENNAMLLTKIQGGAF